MIKPAPEPPRHAFAGDDLFFKRLDMPLEALEWQERVLSALRPDGFRVALPLRSRAGELVVDGWTAWPRLAGEHGERWPEIVAVGERFHRALADCERPAFLTRRTDPWAAADRIAWREVALPIHSFVRLERAGDDRSYEALLAGAGVRLGREPARRRGGAG